MFDAMMFLLLGVILLGVPVAIAFAWLGYRRSFAWFILPIIVYSALCVLTPIVGQRLFEDRLMQVDFGLLLLLIMFGAISFVIFSIIGLAAWLAWRTKPDARADMATSPESIVTPAEAGVQTGPEQGY